MEDANFTLGVTLVVIIIFGTVGNISSFLTWTIGRHCKNFPGTMFLRVLALSDTFMMCFPAVQFSLILMFQLDLKNLHDVTCKLFDALGHFCALLSTWLVVSVTVHRTIAVCAPLKSARLTGKHNEIVVIAVLTFLFCFLNLPYGLSFHMVEFEDTTPIPEKIPQYLPNITTDAFTDTTPSDLINITLPEADTFTLTTTKKRQIKYVCQGDPEAFLQKWHEWIIDVALLFVIPFSFLVVCNAILLVKIFRRYDDLFPSESQMNKDKHDGAFASMTARVVAISITHLVLVGPTAITGLIPGFPHSAYIMTHVLYFTNHGVNFIFYSLFGTSFRRDWLALCCKTYRRTSGQNSGLANESSRF